MKILILLAHGLDQLRDLCAAQVVPQKRVGRNGHLGTGYPKKLRLVPAGAQKGHFGQKTILLLQPEHRVQSETAPEVHMKGPRRLGQLLQSSGPVHLVGDVVPAAQKPVDLIVIVGELGRLELFAMVVGGGGPQVPAYGQCDTQPQGRHVASDPQGGKGRVPIPEPFFSRTALQIEDVVPFPEQGARMVHADAGVNLQTDGDQDKQRGEQGHELAPAEQEHDPARAPEGLLQGQGRAVRLDELQAQQGLTGGGPA